ncbi:MAG TPA: hypothetical protein VJL59_05535 [Anaerolineales bacterium]|nr:hypothetical protein [Anaerolineales bacterium]
MPWAFGPPDTRIKLDDLATPDDNRDLNATILRHGLMPKLSGAVSDFLNGKGEWGPAGGAATLTSVIDSLFTIIDDLTPSKVAMFQCDGLLSGTHTYAFPPSTVGTTVTIAALELAQTFTQPQIIDPGAVGDVPLKLVGQAGQTADLLQLLSSANVVLAGINEDGDVHGGALSTDSLDLLSNDFSTTSAARIRLTNTPSIIFDVEGGSVDPMLISLGLVSGTLTGTSLSVNLVDAGGNNSTIDIDNRGGGVTAIPLRIWRATLAAGANLTEWRDEADVIMSRIRSDGAFIGPGGASLTVAGYPSFGFDAFGQIDAAVITKPRGLSGTVVVSGAPVNLTGQSSSIGTTALFTPSALGLFMVVAYITCTTAGDAGDFVLVSLSWNDGTVAQSIALVSSSLDSVGSIGSSQFSFIANASTISYSTVLSSPGAGTPAHTLYMRLVAL